MAIPRSIQVSQEDPSWVHCSVRCGRQAFLAGDGYEHRRDWVERRLQFLTGIFGCEIAAYAVMPDHFHLVLRMSPEAVAGWSDEEVARRWLRAYPGHRDEAEMDVADASSVAVDEGKLAKHAADATWIDGRRQRLASLSWFMRSLSEPIGRRANQEDGCRGRFWEGRFHSTPLVDEAGLLACMVYVDLNPIRSRMATSIAESATTSALLRLTWAQGDQQRTTGEPPWLASLQRLSARRVDDEQGALSPRQYLRLVETTGQTVLGQVDGANRAELADLVARIDPDIQLATWIKTMRGWRQMSAGSVGRRESLEREAERRGHRRGRTRCELFRRRPAADQAGAG